MPARLDDIRITPLANRRNNTHAFISGMIKLADSGYIYLNGMRLVHSPKATAGLFLAFPAWPTAKGSTSDWKETYFLSKPDQKQIEKQVIHAYNRKMAI